MGVQDVLLWLVVVTVCAAGAGKIAEKRHLRPGWFAVAGFAFGVFGVLAAWVWPDPVKRDYRRRAANIEISTAERRKNLQAGRLTQLARDKRAGRF